MIGWSTLGGEVLRELDQFLTDGSTVDLFVNDDVLEADEPEIPDHSHCDVQVHLVPPGANALLREMTGQTYDQAIVLGYREGMTPAQADARTMLTVLALTESWRNVAHRPRIVAEMLDRSNVDVAQTIGVDDFIISDELSSLMMAQLSERLQLQDVFRDFFDAEGCYISLHPAGLYPDGAPRSYAAIVVAAAAYGQTALGYRQGDAPVVLNPPKSQEVQLALEDQVLVLGPRSIQPIEEPPPAVDQSQLNGVVAQPVVPAG
jgi:hypothetical protein